MITGADFSGFRSLYHNASSSAADESLARLLIIMFSGMLTLLFFLTWQQPLLEQHGFRQTQTALTAYWMREGYGLFDYITPVVGYPWAIPFEVPWYQWLVAKLSTLTGLGLDPAGRLVSFSFSLATLWPASRILRSVGVSHFGIAAFTLLYLACPQYAFWGRTFMMETTALFFAVAFLACVLAFVSATGARRSGWLVLAVLTGIVAGTQKVTTFVPIWIAVGILLGSSALQGVVTRSGIRYQGIRAGFTIGAGMILVIPMLIVVLWTAYSDSIKELNAVGQHLTSSALREWNFGTFAQRVSAKLWIEVIPRRVLDIGSIGAWMALGLAALAVFVLRGRALWLFLAALALFLSPFLIFTNLHLVHNYYQTGNVIFLLAAVAILIDQVHHRRRRLAWALLAAVLVSEGFQYTRFYLRYQATALPELGQRTLAVAAVIRERVAPDHAILVFGLGWSSELAYYGKRKAMTVWDAVILPQVLEDYKRFLGDMKLGAVVVCPSADGNLKARRDEGIDRIVEGFAAVTVRDCVVYVAQ